MISFTLDERVVTKKNAPRREREKRKYFKEKVTPFQDKVRIAAMNACRGKGKKPIYGTAGVYMYVAAFYKGKRRHDAANIGDCICDALQGIVYEDDKQIVNYSVIIAYDMGFDGFEVKVGLI